LVAEEPAQAPALADTETHHTSKNIWGHRWLESRPVQFSILAFIAVAIGGIVEIVPTFLVKSNVPTIASVKPYTPLELQGRDIYVREGCYVCHSQMIRPFRSETERYGEYSKPGEFVYDHPFQWGSKRTGPDLHRVGGKYPDAWHYNHMVDPRTMSPGSIMPPYPWLAEQTLDMSTTEAKIKTMQTLGVPYPENYAGYANQDLMTQANEIVENLKGAGIETTPDKEMVALIAYLQRLGTDIKVESTARLNGSGE
jgi:cytochrome c oxidase cbb3-type subunit I/II